MSGTEVLMLVIGVLVASVVFFFLIALLVPKIVFSSMKAPLEGRIAARYQPDEILMRDLRANTFGQESLGVWQGRGNGALVLTGKQLHFFRFMPEAELAIPLETITDITFTKSHLGKRTIYDLLKVSFTVDGKPDSVAWYLTDPTAWKTRIESLRSGGATSYATT